MIPTCQQPNKNQSNIGRGSIFDFGGMGVCKYYTYNLVASQIQYYKKGLSSLVRCYKERGNFLYVGQVYLFLLCERDKMYYSIIHQS